MCRWSVIPQEHANAALVNARVAEEAGCVQEAKTWEICSQIAEVMMQLEPDSRGWSSFFMQLLHRLADTDNTRMCVLLTYYLLALTGVSRELQELLTGKVTLAWTVHYLDQLYRRQLFAQAAALIKHSPHDTIKVESQLATTYYTLCGQCGKPSTQPACERCHAVSTCSVCQLPSQHAHVHCRECKHGGHHACLLAWFNDESECPAACQHRCLL